MTQSHVNIIIYYMEFMTHWSVQSNLIMHPLNGCLSPGAPSLHFVPVAESWRQSEQGVSSETAKHHPEVPNSLAARSKTLSEILQHSITNFHAQAAMSQVHQQCYHLMQLSLSTYFRFVIELKVLCFQNAQKQTKPQLVSVHCISLFIVGWTTNVSTRFNLSESHVRAVKCFIWSSWLPEVLAYRCS